MGEPVDHSMPRRHGSILPITCAHRPRSSFST